MAQKHGTVDQKRDSELYQNDYLTVAEVDVDEGSVLGY